MTISQNVSWNEIESLVEKLSERILDLSRSFSSITTLSRGGLVPSRLLADGLGIKTILVDQKTISSDSLFVDDIFDSGKTFHNTLLNVAEKTFDDSYVVFPWDKFEYEQSLK